MLQKPMTRRSFLKTTAVTGAALAASQWLSFGDWLTAAEKAEVVVRPTLCNGCSSRCGVLVHLKNGRIWKITGNPDHPASKGKVCARGQGVASWVYHPDRLTQPLKRVGDSKFEPITWEQAFKEIGEKLQEIRQKYGGETIFYAHNPKEIGEFYGERLAYALGTPTILSHHVMCSLNRDVGMQWTLGGVPSADVSKAKYMIFIGRSYADGIKPSSISALLKAKSKGAKIIVIDPRYNSTAPLADKWLPINPGTDLAFLLAMAHVIIRDKLYDEEFVTKNAVGFPEFAAAMAQYTPAWAEKITGIKAETIEEIATDFAKAKPKAFIEPSWKGGFGCSYQNSTETARMVALVNALIGNINRQGGLVFGAKPKLGKLDHTKFPEPEKPKGRRLDEVGENDTYPLALPSKGIIQLVAQKAKEGKAKAGIVYHFNPIRNVPDPQHMIEGFKNLELLVVIDMFMSETAELAHYVLPEPTYLERTELVEPQKGWVPGVAIRAKVLDPIHQETKPFDEIVTGIAKAAGVGQYFNFTLEEVNRILLAGAGITLEQLLEKGVISFKDQEMPEGFTELKTPSKKVEFASQAFAKAGFSAVPQWIEPLVKPNPEQGEFRLLHGKQGIHSHTSTANLPVLLEITKQYDMERLWIPAKRAKALGIKDGDWVIVENDRAKGRIRAKVTELLHPDVVYLPGHYGSFAKKMRYSKGFGISMNDFIKYMIEPMSGAVNAMEVVVKVRKEA
ncbi:MAG: molybdopterin-containing oxidoreductase family protein [Bacillota bacterium]